MFWLLVCSTFLQLSVLIQDGTAPASSTSEATPAAASSGTTAADTATTSGAAGAQPESGKAPADNPRGPQEAPSPYLQFLPILIIGVFFYIILLRPQQREQKRRLELLNTLKKNDKVVTTGGLIGTIADISTDGKQVTLRVDDTTRIRFLRSAIHGPLDDKAEPGNAGSA